MTGDEQLAVGEPRTLARRWRTFCTRLAVPAAAPVSEPAARRLLWIEIAVVLAATFGLSGYTSLLSLAQSVLSAAPLAEQTQTLNASASTVQWLDFGYQLGRIVRLVAWTALPLVLLARTGILPAAVGLGRHSLGRDVGRGAVLAAVIGIPGLGLYVASVAAGVNLQVAASGLTETWWRVPVLLASALANAGAEEVLVAVYLVVRLRQLGVPVWGTIAASAVLRGSYHLYQGFGGGLGNLAMGVLCAGFWLYARRAWPLVVAHFLLDAVAFLGYAFLAPHVGWL